MEIGTAFKIAAGAGTVTGVVWGAFAGLLTFSTLFGALCAVALITSLLR